MELLGEEEQAPAAADQQAAVEAEAAAAEEERQLLALAGAEAPASQSVLPGSTAAGVPCAPGGAAAAAAAQGGSEEQDELLALLEEGDAEGQEQGSGAAPALASEEPQPSLVQPSPEFGAFTAPDAGGSAWVPESEAQPEAAGTQAGGSEVAAVAEPSLVLGPGSEAACCVPESEPISDPTQEL